MSNLFTAPPSGYLRSRTRKNASLMAFWSIVLMMVYIMYMQVAWIYVVNSQSNGFELNVSALMQDTESLTVTRVVADSNEELDRTYATAPESWHLEYVFVDSHNHYRFNLQLDSYQEIGKAARSGLYAKFAPASEGDYAERFATAEYIEYYGVTEIDGLRFLVISPFGLEVKAGQTFDNVLFTRMTEVAGINLARALGEESVVYADYVVDLRNITVDSEGNDFFLSILFSILFPGFFVYAMLALIFPRLHPNYLVLSRWADTDEVSQMLDEEVVAEGSYKERRKRYTDHFIITETLHSTKIVSNHLTRH